MAFTKAEAKAVKTAAILLKRELTAGEEVSLHGFGSFKVKAKAERNGFKPGTKDPIVIPAHKTINFKGFKSWTSTL